MSTEGCVRWAWWAGCGWLRACVGGAGQEGVGLVVGVVKCWILGVWVPAGRKRGRGCVVSWLSL